jgi:hypothetical protein
MSEAALAIALFLIPLVEDWRGKDGDGGHSRGCYQIGDDYRNDVNRFSGCNYTREDCYNPVYARRMTEIYLRHYGTRERLGHSPSAKDLVRIHNAGPDGHGEHCSLAYWFKCRRWMWVAVNELKAKGEI